MFWDLHQAPGGALEMETDDGMGDYTALFTTGTVADGHPHQVIVQRVGGALTISVGSVSTSPVTSNANFGALVPMQQGTTVCPEAQMAVNIANVCVTSP
jgi:hypothetical protein